MPHWMPRLRDWDLSVWDEVRNAQARLRADARRHEPSRAGVAVFRGGLSRSNVYSDQWRERGDGQTTVTAANWRKLGRTALLHAKSDPASAPFVNVNLGELFAAGKLA
eukprot:905856-Prymnesium_polylepis.1